MYISRVELAVHRIDAMRLVSSPYRLHAAVAASMPVQNESSSETGRVLWRIDKAPREDALWLYIVSPHRPDLASIAAQTGALGSCSWAAKDYDSVLQRLQKGQVWQFRLKANPVRKVYVDRGRVGHHPKTDVVGTIQGHVTEVQQRNWLLERAEHNGFVVCRDDEGNERMRVSQRRREEFKRGKQKVTLATAQYDGLLEVVDADVFKRTLMCGLGRGKGFGCGLMTIAPAHSCNR